MIFVKEVRIAFLRSCVDAAADSRVAPGDGCFADHAGGGEAVAINDERGKKVLQRQG